MRTPRPAGDSAASGSDRRPGLLATYFRSAASPSLDEIRPAVWRGDPAVWDEEDAAYRGVVLEQYKIYVEMADRVSVRRGLTNTFFLTLNTAILTVVGVFWQRPPPMSPGLLVLPWFALVVQCFVWFLLLRSYRQLNTAKYAVVGVLEERLPASPYWRAEWAALGEGKDPARYWPLSHVEQWIPALFALAYTVGLLAALLT